MVYAMAGIAFLGFIVWAHHMFQSGMNPSLGTTFAVSTIFIAVPSAIKTFNWLGTLWGGNIRFTTAMWNAIAFVAMFVIGGLSGIFMASTAVDVHIHDTYFIVAHIHYVLFGGSMFGIWAGIYFWYPKMFGRMMNEKLGKIHFWLNFIAMNLTFFPMHFSGMLGMPRRIYTYDSGQGWDAFNLISSIGSYMLVVSTALFFYNFFRSRKTGAIAGSNPWDAGTLEWTIPSPVPHYNFATLPRVSSRYPLWEGNEKDLEDARTNSQEGKTAEELGIVLPYMTIKPMIVAGAMVFMFLGLMTSRALVFIGAAVMVVSLYSWLTAPLEPEHH
jgi:cytochrome c oxidase subunit 1